MTMVYAYTAPNTTTSFGPITQNGARSANVYDRKTDTRITGMVSKEDADTYLATKKEITEKSYKGMAIGAVAGGILAAAVAVVATIIKKSPDKAINGLAAGMFGMMAGVFPGAIKYAKDNYKLDNKLAETVKNQQV